MKIVEATEHLFCLGHGKFIAEELELYIYFERREMSIGVPVCASADEFEQRAIAINCPSAYMSAAGANAFMQFVLPEVKALTESYHAHWWNDKGHYDDCDLLDDLLVKIEAFEFQEKWEDMPQEVVDYLHNQLEQ